jgi:PhnB protein
MTEVNPIPEGFPTVTPHLCVEGADGAIDFYTRVFGATERLRQAGQGGTVWHAELVIGDSVIIVADQVPGQPGMLGPRGIGGTPVSLWMYVPDVDAVVARAVASGARIVRPVETRFYGDRLGQIEDPFGHLWGLATHVEDVPAEEIQRRAESTMAGH